MATQSEKPTRKRTMRPNAGAAHPAPPPSGRPTRARGTRGESPEISLSRTPAGRETLAAIAAEVAGEPATAMRPKLETVYYEERPRISTNPRPPLSSAPEAIVIEEAPVGRATMVAIEEDLASELLEATAPRVPARAALPALLDAPVLEMATFIVRDGGALLFGTPAFQREFVTRRLLHRLPASSMKDIERIEVVAGPTEKDTTVRVLCRVGPPPVRSSNRPR